MMPLIVPDSDQSESEHEARSEQVMSAPAKRVVPIKKATNQVINIESDGEDAPACSKETDKIFDFPDDVPVKHQAGTATSRKRKRGPAHKEKVKEVFQSEEFINSSDEDSDLIDLGTSQRRPVEQKVQATKTRPSEPCLSAKAPIVVQRAAVKVTPRRTIHDYCAGPLSSSDSSESDGDTESISKKKQNTPKIATKASPNEIKASKSIAHASSQARRISSSKAEQDALASIPTLILHEASKPQTVPRKAAQKRTGARSPRRAAKSTTDTGRSSLTPPSIKTVEQEVEELVVSPVTSNQAIAQDVLRGSAQAEMRQPLQASISQTNLATVVNSEDHLPGASMEVGVLSGAQVSTAKAPPVKVMPGPELGRVVNYAASKALPIQVRPRLATGLSRRQRVEPLHKMIKK